MIKTLDLTKFSPGRDQYFQFLEWLPTQIPPDSLIIEGGTYEGRGARSLGSRGHRIITCDPWPQFLVSLPPNVEHRPVDIFDLDPALINSCDLFYLDIDPHEGASEAHFYHHLIKIGFRGLLLCDDIHLNPGMKAFWTRITHPKYDLRDRAHNTGTGLVSFNPEATIIPPTD